MRPPTIAKVSNPLASQRHGGVARFVLALLMATLLSAAVPAASHAVIYVNTGEDIPVPDPGPNLGPSGVAVNQANGDVYASTPFAALAAGNTILRFDAAGAPLGGFASSLTTVGLAIGPPGTSEAGNVFALDAGLLDTTADINAFTATGTPVGSPFAVDYVLGEPLPTPQLATLASEGSTLLFYPNAVDDVVDIFTPDGTLLPLSLNGSDAATTLLDPSAVAVDNGFNAYVVDAADGGRVVKINPFSGSSVLAGTSGAVTVAVNPVSGEVFVGQGSGSAFHVVVFDSSGAQIGDFGAGEFAAGNAFTRRIAVNADSSKVYVSESTTNPAASPPRIEVYKEGAPPPVVTTMTPFSVSQTTATLAGSVAQSSIAPIDGCRFEYTEEADFGANGFANAASAPCSAQYPNGPAELVLVSANVTGLDPNTAYRVRLVATNEGGAGEGTDVAFATPPHPPAVATGAATAIQQTQATLGGTVNPNGSTLSTCRIEYGTTTDYGRSRPCAPQLGAGTSPAPVSAALADLAPGTTYHYRVRAVNAGGATNGPDRSFQTTPRSEPCGASPEACKAIDRCAANPACPAPPGATLTIAPRAQVEGARALLALACAGPPGSACKGELKLSARIARPGKAPKRATLGRARYELPVGERETLKVDLSAAATSALAEAGRLRATVSGPNLETETVTLLTAANRKSDRNRGRQP